MNKTTRQIVHKVEPGMDRRADILCTTYQMRNFYRQFGDGFFKTLDVMNYIQHHQIVKWCKPGTNLLDVCCGRGLLLPMLRYYCKELNSYTGVDIEPRNVHFLKKRVTDGKPVGEDYYPFSVEFVHSNVATMSKAPSLANRLFDVIAYTSSIEHMHKDDGLASLGECRKLLKLKGMMVLTCPNTPEGKDGYDTQYQAHVYEWKRSELINGLTENRFQVVAEYGLLHDKKTLKAEMERAGMGATFDRVSRFVPNEWLIPVFSPLFPRSAKEIGFLCKAV